MTLSPRQQEIVIFLHTYLRAYGIAPSYDQIALAIGLKARSAVMKEIVALEQAGRVRRIPACNNAIELLPSEDHHAANCVCSVCAHARYLAALQIVKALEVTPPTSIIFALRPNSNLRLRTSPEIGAQPCKVAL